MKKNIVIFAPHPDDEVLGCYEIIRRDPARVYVVLMTNGDYEGADVARRRWEESTAALAHLGVPADRLIALGYADTGMARPVSFLWRLWNDETGAVLPSKIASETYHPAGGEEFRFARTGEHAPYTRQAVLEDLAAVLDELQPAEVYLPTVFDAHGDHAGAAHFLNAVLASMDAPPTAYHYHIHSGDDTRWPNRTGDAFVCPANLPEELWDARRSVPVSDPADFARTLWMYASQMCEDEYMLSFVKREQLFFSPV